MPCVLIVTDDADLRQFLEYLLKATGYETISAHNSREALDQMQTCNPCLVLLDLHLPMMDGFELRRRQLRDPKQADVPVVAVTARYDPQVIEKQLHIKCLHEPFSVDHLLTEVRHACRNGRV